MLNKKFHTIRMIFMLNVIVMALSCETALCQKIKIGQNLPDTIFNNIYNYSKKQIRFSDFKAKLIILDFWSPSCSACIESFPKLDQLQKQFDGEIQIILVNKESLDSTKHLFAKRKYLYKPNLPFITGDIYLNKMFSIYGLPAGAWVGNTGKFYGLTQGRPASNEIQKFLEGIDTVKKSQLIKRKYLPDLLDPQYRESVEYYSIFSHIIEKVNVTGNHLETSGIGILGTIPGLYQKAYDPNYSLNYRRPGRMIIETNDSTRYFRPQNDNLKRDWDKKYFYNYTLLLPPDRAKDKYKLMQEDLSRYFDIKVTIQKRIVKCLVLAKVGDIDKIKSHTEKKTSTFLMNSGARGLIFEKERQLTNQPYSLFSAALGAQLEYLCKIPFIDETGISENIDIKFDGQLLDEGQIPDWQKALAKYNLSLIKTERLIDVLVLNDKK